VSVGGGGECVRRGVISGMRSECETCVDGGDGNMWRKGGRMRWREGGMKEGG